MVTVGGYEALHLTINAVTNPGDEVILIEPFFDSYSETVRTCGGVARFIPLVMREGGTTSNDFVLDHDLLASMFNEKTKAIVVNTPHNPTGKVRLHDLLTLWVKSGRMLQPSDFFWKFLLSLSLIFCVLWKLLHH